MVVLLIVCRFVLLCVIVVAVVAATCAVVAGYRIETAQDGKIGYRSVGVVGIVAQFPHFLHADVAQKRAEIDTYVTTEKVAERTGGVAKFLGDRV